MEQLKAVQMDLARQKETLEQIFEFFIDTTNRIMKAFTPFAKKYKHK